MTNSRQGQDGQEMNLLNKICQKAINNYGDGSELPRTALRQLFATHTSLATPARARWKGQRIVERIERLELRMLNELILQTCQRWNDTIRNESAQKVLKTYEDEEADGRSVPAADLYPFIESSVYCASNRRILGNVILLCLCGIFKLMWYIQPTT